jgi:hypothetical protein
MSGGEEKKQGAGWALPAMGVNLALGAALSVYLTWVHAKVEHGGGRGGRVL